MSAGRGRVGPRARLVASFAVLALAASTATAHGAEVTVFTTDGAPSSVSIEGSSDRYDVQGRDYAVRDTDGSEVRRTVSGLSFAALLDAAGVDPIGFSYAEIVRPGGGGVLLSRDQATRADAFADGPPVFFADAGQASFLRPSAGSDDPNAADAVSAPAVEVRLRRGTLLEVDASVSPRRVDPRERVTFDASVGRAGSGEQVELTWNLDDGTRATGEQVTHRYARPGRYDVVVSATTTGDEVGSSAVVSVQVGDPAEGPDRKGGGTNPDASAPDSGPGTGAGSGSGSGSGDAGGAGLGSAAEGAGSARAPADPADRDRRRERRRGDSSERVEGTLLADAADSPSPAVASAAQAARTGRPDTDSATIPREVWGIALTLALLAAGGLLELRGQRGGRTA